MLITTMTMETPTTTTARKVMTTTMVTTTTATTATVDYAISIEKATDGVDADVAPTQEEARAITAALLAELGVKAGDRVALLCRNRIEFFELLFAAAKLGAVLVPLNWRMPARELLPLVEEALQRAASLSISHLCYPPKDVALGERRPEKAAHRLAPAQPLDAGPVPGVCQHAVGYPRRDRLGAVCQDVENPLGFFPPVRPIPVLL